MAHLEPYVSGRLLCPRILDLKTRHDRVRSRIVHSHALGLHSHGNKLGLSNLLLACCCFATQTVLPIVFFVTSIFRKMSVSSQHPYDCHSSSERISRSFNAQIDNHTYRSSETPPNLFPGMQGCMIQKRHVLTHSANMC